MLPILKIPEFFLSQNPMTMGIKTEVRVSSSISAGPSDFFAEDLLDVSGYLTNKTGSYVPL
jgi:hypothetical protein